MNTVDGHLPLRVRVVLPGDPYTGRVGIVERIIIDDDHGWSTSCGSAATGTTTRTTPLITSATS
jgi:hypothetical protein